VSSRLSKRLSKPRPTRVWADQRGVPVAFGRVEVETVREEWVVEEGWWTGRPLRRRYFELVLTDGRDVVVFKDMLSRRWFKQRA